MTAIDGGLPGQVAYPPPDLTEFLARFREVRAYTEELAAPLSPEDQTVQTIDDVSPTKWHRAHTTWFFETFLLSEQVAGYVPVDPTYWYLFNSYYEALGPRFPRPQRGNLSRPGAAEVGAYRQAVDKRVETHLHALVERPESREAVACASIVELGINHEQQHQELLLMDIKHVLSVNPMRPAYVTHGDPHSDSHREPRPMRWLPYEGGLVEIGHDGAGFHFDNEAPRHRVFLEPFAIADRVVTAGEWCEFIDAGGYQRPELWLSDGWARVKSDNWEAPLYWSRQDDAWWQHTLTGTRPVLEHEPVCHVSHYEADAYATWRGCRLPTEFEWEYAVTAAYPDSIHREPTRSAHWHPEPQSVDDALGQAFGEVWQWTSSAYLPYPGFSAAPGAVGEYNGKFMSGQMVLRGSCALTPVGHSRSTYRNFFPAHSRWMMAGVRLASDLS